MERLGYKVFWWLPTGAYMGLIFYLSSKTGDQISIPTPDYVAHTAEYFGLSVLLTLSLRKTTKLSWYIIFIIAVLTASVYGISDEWHQSFVTGRYSSASDWIADTVGALMGQLGVMLTKYVFGKR